jgi:hypothetical protein
VEEEICQARIASGGKSGERPGVKSFSLPGMSSFGHVIFLDCYELSQTVACLRVIDIVLYAPFFDRPCHFLSFYVTFVPIRPMGKPG